MLFYNVLIISGEFLQFVEVLLDNLDFPLGLGILLALATLIPLLLLLLHKVILVVSSYGLMSLVLCCD